jgi:ribokinase
MSNPTPNKSPRDKFPPESAIDIISIGSAVQDVFVNIPAEMDNAFVRSNHLCMSLGSKINVEYPLQEVGGGGTNTAVNFSIQGLKSAILSRIANDKGGEAVLSRLRKFHVNTEFLQIDSNNKARTGMSIILNVPGQDRTVLVNRGVSHMLNFEEVNWTRLSLAKWIYIGAFGSRSEEDFDRIYDLANRCGIKIAFNPGIAQIKKGLEALGKIISVTDLLVMNRTEAAILTNSSKSERVTVILQKLKDLGPKVAIITHGRNGVFVADEVGGRFFISPLLVEATCTLGAGDAFASTFAASVIKDGWDIPLGLKRATINAANVVQNPGAQIGLEPMERLDAYLEDLQLEVEDLSLNSSKSSTI